jgi:uncharacterized damage-inducible protein DinB
MQNKFVIFCLCLCLGTMAHAQISADSLKQNLISEWKRAKIFTDEYLEAMPANKYAFRAVDSTRSFSELMLHLASSNLFFGANGTGAARISFGTGLEKRSSSQNKDSVKYYVDRSYDFIIESLTNMDASKIYEAAPAGRMTAPLPRYMWLFKAFEHQTHERGQGTIYIRLQGIRPPAEKLF